MYIVQKNLISNSSYKFPNYSCGKEIIYRRIKQGDYKILQNKHGGRLLIKKGEKIN